MLISSPEHAHRQKLLTIDRPSREYAQVSALAQQKLESLIQYRVNILQSGDHATEFLQLPTIADCVAHLKLLNAFVYLKSRVLSWNDQSGTPSDDVWRQYLRFAVIRFNIWMRALDVTGSSPILPPLGTLHTTVIDITVDASRCIDGLACFYAEPSRLSEVFQCSLQQQRRKHAQERNSVGACGKTL